MYILYFVLNNQCLTLCVSTDIEKLKQHPKFDIDWSELSLTDNAVYVGETTNLFGWWLIEQVKQI